MKFKTIAVASIAALTLAACGTSDLSPSATQAPATVVIHQAAPVDARETALTTMIETKYADLEETDGLQTDVQLVKTSCRALANGASLSEMSQIILDNTDSDQSAAEYALLIHDGAAIWCPDTLAAAS